MNAVRLDHHDSLTAHPHIRISHKPIDMAQNMAITNEAGSFPGGSYEASVVKGHYEYSVNIEDEAIQALLLLCNYNMYPMQAPNRKKKSVYYV